jgi:hypothetical protein
MSARPHAGGTRATHADIGFGSIMRFNSHDGTFSVGKPQTGKPQRREKQARP